MAVSNLVSLSSLSDLIQQQYFRFSKSPVLQWLLSHQSVLLVKLVVFSSSYLY